MPVPRPNSHGFYFSRFGLEVKTAILMSTTVVLKCLFSGDHFENALKVIISNANENKYYLQTLQIGDLRSQVKTKGRIYKH